MEGDGGLPPGAAERVRKADVILGERRHFNRWKSPRPPSLEIRGGRTLIPTLRSYPHRYQVVVLDDGDPLDHGIGEVLVKQYPSDRLSVIPARSYVQLALSSLRIPRSVARVLSLRDRPIELIRHALVRQPEALVVLTDHHNSPGRILTYCKDLGSSEYVFNLLERPGAETERHHTARDANDLPSNPDPLNLVVLTHRRERPRPDVPRPGIPNAELTAATDSMITPHHQRMMNLGHLQLRGEETVWDIGAATGSVSIEAARIHPDASFHAVEKREDRLATLRSNVKSFRTYNVIPHHGEAPEILSSLPDPDRVFLGGSGGRAREIVDVVVDRLNPGGLILANFITFENANQTRDRLLEYGFTVDERLVTVHRQGTLNNGLRLWEDAGVLHQLIAVPRIR